ncbi:Hsp70 family chaperone Lhs1/Orp150, putative [Talaromyces stipitatus ATCC 10500]|uniref:Hsp70 family chaperone Lhs1/Orp150, putative n=1 Tax=Talaromyces stipitatus (strain ATCC 10500 / CBS 375.48 / QM 6759 / NRRL 1006) TaxID=441959 RepID=B8M2T6_TALSN|nr:Hsp70 family chaperone Lhs1/Orp150, putative [Talaromyces stipitatus ATCC 10500]EED22191.1 Hsp70 family chaperone Lhs1/Orp150, putative [Talaromyces stipitatus ATCC 10500]
MSDTLRRRNMPLSAYSPFLTCVLFPFLLFLLCLPSPASAAGSAVLGIDLGTEYLKAALVKPGIPLEIVLTKDSKRKEYAAVAFKPSRDGNAAFPERFYGSDALALAPRYPDDVYSNLKTLLGIPFAEDSDAVKLYSGRYPALQLESAQDRGTIALRSQRFGATEGKDAFLVEEILSMQLKQIKANAETLAGKGSTIRDAVITYPAYYTAEEKRSVELAAELAGLHVEALISDGLAVGLNYATSRTFPSVSDGEQPEYHLVYDMGAGSTTATVLRFQSRAVKDVGRFNKTVQEVHVLGAGWDRTVGGDALNQLIVDDMVNKLVESKKLKDGTTVSDVKAHGKTMAKLWKDSGRVRQILSANTETSATFEGLYEEDVIFKYKITRSEFEKLAKDQAARVGNPIEDALKSAGLKLSDLESVILHGGTIRTPFVQKQLEKQCGSGKLRTNVNADEAAVFGAAFKGAALSPSFRVKDIRAVDSASYAVKIKWTSDEKERQQKLFTPTSQVGVEKQVTVKNLEDFEFSFYQQIPAGEDVIDSPVLNVATQNLTASVSKLTEKFGCAPVNITTKLNVRLSPVDGLPEVTGASVSCEVDASKKGSVVADVKGFFGLGKKDDQKPLKEETGDEPTESVTLEDEAPTSSAEEMSTTTVSAKETQKAESASRIESITINFKSSPLGRPPLSTTELKRIKHRLAAFDASDRERVLREEALNELEAFIYKGRDLVDDSEFLKAVKGDQLTILKERLEAASEWLYGDGADASTKELKEKLASLTEIVKPALKRKKENSERGVKVQLLQEMLNGAKSIQNIVDMQIQNDEEIFSSSQAAESASSTSETSTASSPTTTPDDLEEDPYSSSGSSSTKSSATAKPTAPTYSIYTPQDSASLKTTLDSVNTWLEVQLEVQKTLSESDDPALTVADIDSKLKELERVLQRIYAKMGAKAGGGDSSSKKSEGKKKDNGKTKSKSEKTSTKPKPSVKDEL